MAPSILRPPRTKERNGSPRDADGNNTISNLSNDGKSVGRSFDEVSDVYGLNSNIMFDRVDSTEIHLSVSRCISPG
jgi:hypothetical protein